MNQHILYIESHWYLNAHYYNPWNVPLSHLNGKKTVNPLWAKKWAHTERNLIGERLWMVSECRAQKQNEHMVIDM